MHQIIHHCSNFLQKLQSLLNIQENYSTCKTFPPFFINPFLSSLNKETEKPSLFALPLLFCTLIEFVWVVNHRRWVAWVAACRICGACNSAVTRQRKVDGCLAWVMQRLSREINAWVVFFFFWLGWWRCSGWGGS